MKLKNLLLKEAKFDTPITAIHGTSSRYLDTILSQGMNPDLSGKGWGTGLGGKPEQRDMTPVGGVYFTTRGRIAFMAANDAARKVGGNPLYVIASLQPKTVSLDEDRIERLLEQGIQEAYREQGLLLRNDPSNAIDFLVETILKNNKNKINKLIDSITAFLIEEAPSLEKLFENYQGIYNELESFIETYFFRIASYYEGRMLPRSLDLYYRDTKDQWESFDDFRNWVEEEFLPHPSEAEQEYKEILDFLSSRFKRIIEDEQARSGNNDSFRITSPVTYSGSNRIITIFETYKEDEFTVDIIYGDLNQEGYELMEEAISIEIGDANIREGNYRIIE